LNTQPQFVDANIFIRHFTQDNPIQSPACTAIFEQAEQNQMSLTTSEAIITEVVQVLNSKTLYNFPRSQIQSVVTALLSLPGMKLPRLRVYKRALKIYAKEKIDFPDCLVVAHMEEQHSSQLYSYDKHFDRFDQVTRLEPELANDDENKGFVRDTC